MPASPRSSEPGFAFVLAIATEGVELWRTSVDEVLGNYKLSYTEDLSQSHVGTYIDSIGLDPRISPSIHGVAGLNKESRRWIYPPL